MNLITIAKKQINDKLIQTVSARELHTFLQSSERFSAWFERQLGYGFVDGVDYLGCEVFNTLAKQTLQDYCISINMAKEISMIQRTNKGKEARQYFINCEQQLQNQFKVPATFKEALLLAVEQQEIIEQQQVKIEQQYNQILNYQTALDDLTDYASIIKVAKHNNISEKTINWRVLKAKSINLGVEVKATICPRYGKKNLYKISVFKICYPQLNYKGI
jgi:anti-repressor protein